jgi:phosphatidylethanolamine/phosphatidyl-N-methylethanolamine N-methyltransferase
MLCLMNSLSFFLHWLSDPLQVGAVAPSSQALAAVMTTEIAPESAPVIELGPGSGAFTRALLDRGVPQRRLALIEQSPSFALALRQRFPDARVLCVDAAILRSIDVFSGEGAGAVVSGLPLLLMSPNKVGAILGSAFKCLRPGGAFYQFTYGSRSPVPRPTLDRLGLTATLIGRTLANIPPAAVYRIQHRSAEQHHAFHVTHEPSEAKRFEHRAASSLLQGGERPVFIKGGFHGIRNFTQRRQRNHRALFRGE